MECIESHGTPNPRVGEPPGTESQIVSYMRNTGRGLERVCRVHRYLRPDGTIGASGKLDPKSILHDGTLYALQVKKRPH